MNDGSRDRTSEPARAFERRDGSLWSIARASLGTREGSGAQPRVRGPERVRRRERPAALAEGHPELFGAEPSDIVIGVLDATACRPARPDRVGAALRDQPCRRRAGRRHDHERRRWAAARCQDIEFVGFSHLAQAARDRIGSVGLGGNGQFTRLSALRSLGRPPWTDCLTEDLDLGLSLTRLGWRIRFCSSAWVGQEGVVTIRAWLRQRTRWAQGHYQCWAHFRSAEDAPPPRSPGSTSASTCFSSPSSCS